MLSNLLCLLSALDCPSSKFKHTSSHYLHRPMMSISPLLLNLTLYHGLPLSTMSFQQCFSSAYSCWILTLLQTSPAKKTDTLVGQTYDTPASHMSTVSKLCLTHKAFQFCPHSIKFCSPNLWCLGNFDILIAN